MQYDVFISYRRQCRGGNGTHVARQLQQELARHDLKVFFDMEELKDGKFDEHLYDSIDESKNVIFLMMDGALDRCVNKNDWVRLELEHVLKRRMNLILVAPSGSKKEFPPRLPKSLKSIKTIEISELNLEKLFVETVSKIVDERLKGIGLDDRTNVQYLAEVNNFELLRLKKEDDLLYPYEKPIYDRLFEGRKGLNVLDFDFLSAESSFRRLVRGEVRSVSCFGYSDPIIKRAIRVYENEKAMRFYKIDITKDDIGEKLSAALLATGAQRFDFLNLTMAILDLQHPYKVLKKIRDYLSDDALVFVRDIDDGIVFAYPDENKLFEQVKKLYKKDKLSGSRESARQVYNIFKRLGARKIRMEHCGIATDQMSFRQKDQLFDTWFGFIPNDYKLMLAKNPKDADAQSGQAWIDANFDRLEEAFHSDNLLFNSGYFIYTIQF